MSKRRTATLTSQGQTIPRGYCLLGRCCRAPCSTNKFECMLINSALTDMVWYGLFSCNLKKAHRYCSAVSAEICAGTGPLNLFESRYLQCKPAEYMLIKNVLSSQHPSWYHLTRCGNRCTCVKKAHRYVSLTSADSSLGICPVRAF